MQLLLKFLKKIYKITIKEGGKNYFSEVFVPCKEERKKKKKLPPHSRLQMFSDYHISSSFYTGTNILFVARKKKKEKRE